MATKTSKQKKSPKIVYKPVLQLPRLPEDQYTGLRDSIAIHGVLVPILTDGGSPRRIIIDGSYRKEFATEFGYDCPEIVQEGLTEEEMRTLARALNLARRQLTTDQKEELIADQLQETPGRSNRWVGKQLGVHHATVTKVRVKLESSGQIIHCEKLVGSDGREQPSRGEYRPSKRVIRNRQELRRPFDFYPTPPHATKALLDRERFSGSILEPACGDGAIVRVLRKQGYDVETADLVHGQDFFTRKEQVANIVTNPPYRFLLEFVQHARVIATRKIALLLPLEFLHGASRYELFQDRRFRLKMVHVFVSRLEFGTGQIAPHAHAWYVWDRRHVGPPTLGWIK